MKNMSDLLKFEKMKKTLLYLFAAVIPALAFTSCDDHDDLPDVSFNVNIADGSFYNNEIYVVQGDTLHIESVAVTNNEQGKAVTIPYVNYYFEFNFIGQNAIEPFGFDIAFPETLPIGRYTLEIGCPVFAVDKAPGYAMLSYRVNVVESVADIPNEATQTSLAAAHVSQQE